MRHGGWSRGTLGQNGFRKLIGWEWGIFGIGRIRVLWRDAMVFWSYGLFWSCTFNLRRSVLVTVSFPSLYNPRIKLDVGLARFKDTITRVLVSTDRGFRILHSNFLFSFATGAIPMMTFTNPVTSCTWLIYRLSDLRRLERIPGMISRFPTTSFIRHYPIAQQHRTELLGGSNITTLPINLPNTIIQLPHTTFLPLLLLLLVATITPLGIPLPIRRLTPFNLFTPLPRLFTLSGLARLHLFRGPYVLPGVLVYVPVQHHIHKVSLKPQTPSHGFSHHQLLHRDEQARLSDTPSLVLQFSDLSGRDTTHGLAV